LRQMAWGERRERCVPNLTEGSAIRESRWRKGFGKRKGVPKPFDSPVKRALR